MVKEKKEEEIRKKLIDNLCNHLEQGKSEYSFAECDFRLIEQFAKEIDTKNNNTSQIEKIRKALRKSFAHWENIFFEMYNDTDKKYFFPAWIYYMKSRFKFGIKEQTNKENEKIFVDLCIDKDDNRQS